ncbi:hypothetical protein [Methylocucumis oryzae]|uniref:Uncharacterized protein n=1 Tax=Methylocucumis oryzae TaxID=1632867 RepID=A0A0F3IEE8_9GAMM|nr:hypothetical protein [Methylocucumis oryzae]KJV05175.1 hypothetical protein VZ94_20100 [Methylocucumis oryzae]
MIAYDLINIIWPVTATMFAMLFGMSVLKEWRASRERDFEMRREELYMRRKEYESANNIIVNNDNGGNYSDLGGYITIDIPEERKSIFHDLLKGFEEYAALKGYKVTVSIDSSIEGKISFKIVIKDFGITGTRNSVKHDLDEYIQKIKSGAPIEDMPELIAPVEHSRLIMALKNRITFLQQNYEVERNIRDFYQKFFERLPVSGFSHASPVFHILNSGATEMDQRKYIANNSANINQGDSQQNQISSGDIAIGSTFTKKSEQLEKLDSLIEALNKSGGSANAKDATRQFENIKEEISDEENPDKSLILKWLEKAKKLLSFAEVGSDVFNKAKSVYESFGMEF